jgi:hypothetical protein
MKQKYVKGSYDVLQMLNKIYPDESKEFTNQEMYLETSGINYYVASQNYNN